MEENRAKVYVQIKKRGNVYHLSELKKYKNRITERMMNYNKVYPRGEGNKVLKEVRYKHRDRIEVPASLNFTLTDEQYNYMTSMASRPFDKFKEWSSMSAKQRLECHLDAICHDYGGYEYNYEIMP